MTRSVPPVASLFDEAPCGMLVTALDGTILKVNATFCDWVGITREELVGKMRLQALFTMGGRIFHQTHWAPSLQMQGSLAEVKFDVRHRNGTTLPMILNARRRKRAEGEFDEISAFVAQDRNRYERELLNARKRADALLETERHAQHLLKDRTLFAEQMVGIVSHDLRNPLAAILMGLQLLDRTEGERRTRVLGHVRDSAERARRLVEEMLDFTQARVGQGLSMKRCEIDLHEVVAQAVNELMLAFQGRQITHVASGPGYCIADPDRLAQLVGNLVSNAAAYGRQGTPIIVRSEGSGVDMTLCVENEGDPIPAELAAKVFEPMVRGVPGGTSARGVGLGLYIVKEIARGHGGEMELLSSLEKGTRVIFRFPSSRGSESKASS